MGIDNLEPDDASKKPEKSQSSTNLPSAKLEDAQNEVNASIEQALSKREKVLKELYARRENGEVALENFEDTELLMQLSDAKEHLKRADLQNRPLVVDYDYIVEIGSIRFMHPTLGEMVFDCDSFLEDDVVVIYPTDLT